MLTAVMVAIDWKNLICAPWAGIFKLLAMLVPLTSNLCWGLQDVLSQVMTNAGGTPMTVAEATLIADNALEHTVRCLLAAMAAPEVLKSTQGAFPRLPAPAPCLHRTLMDFAHPFCRRHGCASYLPAWDVLSLLPVVVAF